MGELYQGDNLEQLREHVADASVELVYADPPFNSKRAYSVLQQAHRGGGATPRGEAFDDSWLWDAAAEASYQRLVAQPASPPAAQRPGHGEAHATRVGSAMAALRALLGETGLLAYLVMMAPRLVELRRVLCERGSLYLHCDPSASHYLKVLLDAVFGPACFRNEIIWRRTGAHGPRRGFGPVHDVILFYTRSARAHHFEVVRRPYMAGHVQGRYRREPDGRLKFTSGGNVLTGAGATRGESGQPWRGFDPGAKGRHWAIPGFLTEQMDTGFAQLGVLAKLDALYAAGLVEILEGAAWPTPLRYLEPGDGTPLSDIWAYQPYTGGSVHGSDAGIDHDVAWLGPTDPERRGYETQKPLGLLRRIIESSCPEGGLVLDPFCGSGTTLVAAQELGRRWVGIDQNPLALELCRERLGLS